MLSFVQRVSFGQLSSPSRQTVVGCSCTSCEARSPIGQCEQLYVCTAASTCPCGKVALVRWHYMTRLMFFSSNALNQPTTSLTPIAATLVHSCSWLRSGQKRTTRLQEKTIKGPQWFEKAISHNIAHTRRTAGDCGSSKGLHRCITRACARLPITLTHAAV